MRWYLGLQRVEQRTRPDKHPREDRDHPNRYHAVPPVVRIAPCPACFKEARRQGRRPQRCCLRGEDEADGEVALCSAQMRGKNQDVNIDPLLETRLARVLYAAISSWSGQVGRADGYILERKELDLRSATTDLYSSLVV